jgi:predicted metal-dependent phosphoesterase TrpH
MNAARFARNLVEDGVEPKLAQSLAEHLADEIDRTVATKEHVEMVVTREVQQLRVEMHEEFQRSDARSTERLDTFQDRMARRFDAFEGEMTQRFDAFESEMTRRFDAFQNQMTQRLDSHIRWLMTSLIVLFLAMLGNIIKDFVR